MALFHRFARPGNILQQRHAASDLIDIDSEVQHVVYATRGLLQGAVLVHESLKVCNDIADC